MERDENELREILYYAKPFTEPIDDCLLPENLELNHCVKCGKGVPHYCEKCHQDLIGENARLQRENKVLKEIEEPINVLINFAVCCSPSLNCDEYCTYNDEDCTCGKLNEDFELRKSVLKLRKYFKMKGVNEDEKEN